MSEEEKKAIDQARSNILRGNDIESAMLIVEKVVFDGLVITGGRVNTYKVAVRQMLNFLEEYKNKDYLDIVREKVKANDKVIELKSIIEKQQAEIAKLTAESTEWESKVYDLQDKLKNRNNMDIFIQLAFELGQAYQNIYNKIGLENVIDFNDIAFANNCGAEWNLKGDMSDLPELFKVHKLKQNGIDELNKIAEDLKKVKSMAKENIEGGTRDGN